jgi:hypothetical protein
MKGKQPLFILITILILMPVLDISGHFINLSEFYLYIIFFLNIKNIKKSFLVTPFAIYTILFFITTILTAAMAGEVLNNYDIFVIRNMIQLIISLILFNTFLVTYAENESKNEHFRTFCWCFGILTIPALIVYLQSANVFKARELVQLLYKPQFFFLKAEDFVSFRYTSVFKDFFTSSVYYIILCGSLFYFYLKSSLSTLRKLPLLFLLLFNYGAQFFVSRTSLVAIPLLILMLLIFGPAENYIVKVKRILFTSIVIVPLLILAGYVVSKSGAVNLEWATEGFNLFSSSEPSGSSSFELMNFWILNFYEYVKNNPKILFMPKHAYDLTESSNPFLYSDSFYPQEIYRYGIYGMVSYLVFISSLIKLSVKKSTGLFLFTMTLVILNYKGGNTFFMPKNIYLYAFVFAFFTFSENTSKERVEVNK